MSFFRLFMFIILSLMVAGCGGGGSGGNSPPAQPTGVTLHLKTYLKPGRTLPSDDFIRSFTVTINLPPGVNIKNGTSGYEIALSGVAAGKSMAMSPSVDTLTPGKLTVILTLLDPIEVGVFEFATINFGVSSGFFPQATDFSIDPDSSKTKVASTTFSDIEALSVSIAEAAFSY